MQHHDGAHGVHVEAVAFGVCCENDVAGNSGRADGLAYSGAHAQCCAAGVFIEVELLDGCFGAVDRRNISRIAAGSHELVGRPVNFEGACLPKLPATISGDVAVHIDLEGLVVSGSQHPIGGQRSGGVGLITGVKAGVGPGCGIDQVNTVVAGDHQGRSLRAAVFVITASRRGIAHAGLAAVRIDSDLFGLRTVAAQRAAARQLDCGEDSQHC